MLGPENQHVSFFQKAQSRCKNGVGKGGKIKEMVEDRLCERVCVKELFVTETRACDKVASDRVVCLTDLCV